MRKSFKRRQRLKVILSIVVILTMLTLNLNSFVSGVFTVSTSTNELTIEKVSNPDSGEGQADGLINGGDRETSYSWAMAARGQYLYIGTNRNVIGNVANAFINAMVSAGITEDVAWGLIDSMTNNEIPRPTTQDGGEIFKCNMLTGEIEKIYTAEANVAFRMATEFEGNLYFASYSSTEGADNYIYKIDEDDNMSIAFTSSNGTSLRASCVYDNSLLFGGVDARIELAEGDEDCQKLAILKKDSNDDTKWDRIADYKDFKDYATNTAVFNSVASPIWDMCTHDGYVYATIPNTAGVIMFKGHPAEGDEPANEYGWYWTEVIGKNNGINNVGLADNVDGYTGDEVGLISTSGTPFDYNGKLYLIDFDNTIMAEVTALAGLVSELAKQDVKPSEYLKTMYTTLQHPQKLWCYDDETGKFNEVEGFSQYMENNCIEYLWRAETYHDELYITTMDSAVIYNYITNLKGTYFTDLTEQEIADLSTKIDDLVAMLDRMGGFIEGSEEIKEMLYAIQDMMEEYITVADDSKLFYEFVIKYEDLINQIINFGEENSDLLEMAGTEFQELYNKVDWEGLKMYAYIAKTIDNDTWGFDLLKTADGENFEIVTDSGFNDKYNYGGRSIMATDYGLYVGTANPFYGTQLWKITDGTEENPNPENPDPENPDPENPDPENPDPENPDPENPDPENPDPENPDPENPDPENPDPENPDPENPDPENPDPENPDPENPDPENPDPENPDPENPDPENPDPENPDPENPDPENPDPENPNPENPDPENPDPENPDPENPDPENPDPENPDPENPDPENPDPENPDPENPDPENPDPENPDPENPDPENPDPENPDSEDPDDNNIQDQWQDQIKDPDKLTDGLQDISDKVDLNVKQPNSTLAQGKLPDAGNKPLFIGICIGTIGMVLASAYKFFRYKDVDKN